MHKLCTRLFEPAKIHAVYTVYGLCTPSAVYIVNKIVRILNNTLCALCNIFYAPPKLTVYTVQYILCTIEISLCTLCTKFKHPPKYTVYIVKQIVCTLLKYTVHCVLVIRTLQNTLGTPYTKLCLPLI